MTTVRDITSRIEQFAPKNLAEEWDPIGLSFGSFDNKVNKVLVALDFDKNTLKEAKEKEAKEKAFVFELSDREKEIVKRLG